MEKSHTQTQRKVVLDSMLLETAGVVAGKMFGYPAYYLNKKLFACIYGSGVGVKVPIEPANPLLSRQQVDPFQPRGKPPMNEWVLISHPSAADYRKDIAIFRSSIDFVRQMTYANGMSKR